MNAPSSGSYDAWFGGLPVEVGIARISPVRAYAHAEESYDAQYGVVTAHPKEGLGLCSLLKSQDLATDGPGIEIGCGSGYLTTGLAEAYAGPSLLVTDPSSTFLRLTHERIAHRTPGPARLDYAVLNGDDLALLPAGMFSLIAMRSTLHHILDFKGFIAACSRALRPGGTLAMGAEPCESGYVLMGAVAQSISPILKSTGVEITQQWEDRVRMMAETMKFYCRRDLDKSQAEDKHLFRVFELSEIAEQNGMQLRYFPNCAFADYATAGAPRQSHAKFSVFFLTYLQYCMGFEVEFVELIGTHLKSQLEYLDSCYPTHAGPLFTGAFLFIRNSN